MNHVIKFALRGPKQESVKGNTEPMWILDVGTHVGDHPPDKTNASEAVYFIPASLPINHIIEKVIPGVLARQLLPFAKLMEHDNKPKTKIPGGKNRLL